MGSRCADGEFVGRCLAARGRQGEVEDGAGAGDGSGGAAGRAERDGGTMEWRGRRKVEGRRGSRRDVVAHNDVLLLLLVVYFYCANYIL